MKISCIQMDMRPGEPDYNFRHAEQLIRAAAEAHPDVIVLPETWNTGFFPKEELRALCDHSGQRTRRVISGLAKELGINIVAGSVADLRDGSVFNTALVFDRMGKELYHYDKIHLFSPSGENEYFHPGESCGVFSLDGIPCGLIICYDLRFPELSRTICAKGAKILFVVSQWPKARVTHLHALAKARAIENQIGLVVTNSCAEAYNTQNAGRSQIIDALGNVIADAGEKEGILSAELSLNDIMDVQNTIPVWKDRRAELYARI